VNAVVVGSRKPVLAVIYWPPEEPNDSGYTVLFDDAPHVDDVTDDDLTVMCLHCLIDAHPEVGRGLDLAREHGHADYDERADEWRTP
jgi:hypothetical protein